MYLEMCTCPDILYERGLKLSAALARTFKIKDPSKREGFHQKLERRGRVPL